LGGPFADKGGDKFIVTVLLNPSEQRSAGSHDAGISVSGGYIDQFVPCPTAQSSKS
jgi:hypothetical protein